MKYTRTNFHSSPPYVSLQKQLVSARRKANLLDAKFDADHAELRKVRAAADTTNRRLANYKRTYLADQDTISAQHDRAQQMDDDYKSIYDDLHRQYGKQEMMKITEDRLEADKKQLTIERDAALCVVDSTNAAHLALKVEFAKLEGQFTVNQNHIIMMVRRCSTLQAMVDSASPPAPLSASFPVMMPPIT